jgi:glycosyltransferase involved in cell wall biosynthesis
MRAGESHERPQLSVVILAYNEERNFPGACGEILETLQTLPVTSELLIVDDGSSDRTGTLADDVAARMARVRVIHHPTNLGLGGGYRTGFTHAAGEFVTFFPADGQFPPSIIPGFLGAMDRADMVLGYLPDRRSSLIAKTLSFLERILYRVLFGRLPKFQGILMFRRGLLAELRLVSRGRGWTVLMELIVRAVRGHYRVISVPTEMRERMSGESKVNNLRTISANFKQVLELYWRL